MTELIIKTGMRVLPALISFILLIIFTAPFFAGIVNAGNCAGAFVSAVMLGIFVFYGRFSSLIAFIWQRTWGKVILCTVSAVILMCIAAALVISVMMIKAAEDKPQSTETTLVVLGCKVKDGKPSRMLRRRLDTAYDFLIENEEVKVIVSGGKGNDEEISEAQCMKDYLAARGISPDRIYMEDKSVSTYENLKFSSEIIKNKQLEEKITIVTDGYHQLRAEMIAEKTGLQAWNVSAPTSLWLIPTYVVREWLAIAVQAVKG